MHRDRSLPWSAKIPFALAVLCLLAAVASLAELFSARWELLNGEAAALMLLISAVGFAGTGAFPLVISRLMQQDPPRVPPGNQTDAKND